MTDFPTGTVTFLFTDIEGSTKLWDRYPELMKAALAQHDALLREAVQVHRGVLIKTTGDGLHAVFADASDAVAAIVAGQRALLLAVWGETGPLRVRMGLHSGGAELRGGDYYGSTLNRAARLMAIAHGGQMLLSATTADLVRDRLPEGCALQDLGEHRLKDLVQPERVSQLCAPDLATDFPPLNSLNLFPNNLPVQLTSFVGRERELSEVKQLLNATAANHNAAKADPVRLLTLIGPGGTGKTRLSLQAAAEVLDAFPAGAWLVELAPLADPALVPQRVASAFGLRETAGRDMLEILSDYLRAKRMLLILDNCEHLIETCARLADDLLRACPKLTILASSREALGIGGETVYRVPSLACPVSRTAFKMHSSDSSIPANSELSIQDSVLAYDAVKLFVVRASAVQPRFALSEQNAPAVVQICQRLDGIPLAIELATARLKLFSAEQIAVRLDDRFRLLTGGSRTALPRQQTLGALIDWSYDLLSEPERVLLRRLSVFAGGWSFEAAEEITKDDPSATPAEGLGEWIRKDEGGRMKDEIVPSSSFILHPSDVLDLLAQLVNKSLVVAQEPDEQGEVRYHYLETIRQYARDKLLASGEAAWMRERHQAWFVQLAESSRPHLFGREQIEWQQRLEPDHDNLRAALEWAVVSDPLSALRMVAGLYFFWAVTGYEIEGRRAAESALEAANRASIEPSDVSRSARAGAQVALGSLIFAQGEIFASRRTLREGIELARSVDDPDLLVFALGMAGLAESMSGDFEGGANLGRKAMEVVAHNRSLHFDTSVINGIFVREAFFVKHDGALARHYLDESIQSARAHGNPFSLAITLMGAGVIESVSGDFAAARAHLLESQEWMRKMGNRPGVIGLQSELAHLARREGDLPAAISLYRETMAGLQEYGHRGAIARNLECLAFMARAQQHPARAARLMGAAEALRETSGVAMMPEERPETDQEIRTLREQLAALEFGAAWAAGRAMSMEQAIEYALTDA